MSKKSPEFNLATLSSQDVIFCPECAILILRHIRPRQRAFPLIGEEGLFCPICDRMLVKLEEEGEGR